MKRFIPIVLVLPFLLGACGALGAPVVDATPTISSEEIRATANAMVYDMLTQTQAAMPTNTLVPPTNTMMPPTNTSLPLPTATEMLSTPSVSDASPTPDISVASPTSAPLAVPTNTQASSAVFPCTEQPLTSWTGESVQLSITNNVNDSTANVFLCITTPYGEAGYISVPLVGSNSVQVPYGTYSATAWVNGKQDFNAYIGFVIKNPGSVQLVIENNQIFFRAGCAPDC